MSAKRVTCAGCGRRARSVGCAALYLSASGGPAVPYVLCVPCTAEKLRDPEPMLERIELRLDTPRGRA